MHTPLDPVLASLGETVAALSVRSVDRPLIVALDGPVAAGKSTLARALAQLLQERGIPTAVISADGFLWPLAKLEADGLIERKGFPESFNRVAMADFLTRLRNGDAPVAPAYAHDLYDVSPTARQPTAGAAAVIFEGVNVLGADLSPLYDLRLYLDAGHAGAWFVDRFVSTPFTERRAAALARWKPADGDPADWARAVWSAVNGPNLSRHIAWGRERADLVLHKDAAHRLFLEAM